jgi:hypothetical protein
MVVEFGEEEKPRKDMERFDPRGRGGNCRVASWKLRKQSFKMQKRDCLVG